MAATSEVEQAIETVNEKLSRDPLGLEHHFNQDWIREEEYHRLWRQAPDVRQQSRPAREAKSNAGNVPHQQGLVPLWPAEWDQLPDFVQGAMDPPPVPQK
jgi:hypothetical protein